MSNKIVKEFASSETNFIEDIIDGMQDWVRVIGKDGRVLFVNKPMRDGLGYDVVGRKCFEVLGRSSPCPNCISSLRGKNLPNSKEETINGRVFSVTSSPLKSFQSNNVEAIIEVLHDITELKALSKELEKQNEQLKEDLSMARKLQCSLLPKQQSVGENISFSYIYKPCEMIGGDFLDIFEIDEEHVGIYIADVSGHGVAASMLTMFLRAAIDKSSLSPAKVLTQLYQEFNKNGFDDELYISVFYGIVNITDYSFSYSNAGLNVSPILFSGDDFKLLRARGIPISNWVDKPEYTEATQKLSPKDRLLFYTDGIIEIKNSSNEQFGEDRIVEHFLRKGLNPSSIISQLVDKALSFSKSSIHDIMDDITIALLEMK
ncbi:protein serine/threonine phosphatase [Ruminiclostridium papyrosolvens DSM 2782]|uniref:Protein serine/threonine phosphatase n=1 Tax=Ruminiclostridium papyrosolvens DSM 2782 TaxID=588581 RepID=F1TB40_9FIRM|nr:SpoIIE family protein phosphatase [Ruminiclostridium papyrosolvens]EGD48244.1 protein serine/threonine phosphatase [Ruminiclostridium papyrosolvens DSM 2782]WES34247.1 SpoIIE family protein phosphatase [Ruminiclostridium papyrosolvens DSM 2782]